MRVSHWRPRQPDRRQWHSRKRCLNVQCTKDGTIKAQLNAIYFKAGVTGRPQLISFFIYEMVDGMAPAA